MRDSRLSVTAYDWVPDFAQGQVRDLRVRWALEEAEFPYEVELAHGRRPPARAPAWGCWTGFRRSWPMSTATPNARPSSGPLRAR